jgi:hypothetical protein
VKDGAEDRYEIRARATETPDSVGIAGLTGAPVLSDPVAAHDNWFRKQRTNSVVFTLILVLILSSIQAARSGKNFFVGDRERTR